MKNILVIAYYFPPSGGPGVQRVLKHVQYFKEFGYNPIVLTVENGEFPARDESLIAKIPTNIDVHRTYIFEPYSFYKSFTGKSQDTPIDVNTIHKEGTRLSIKENIAELIRATIFIPDARIGWLFTAKNKAMELVHKFNIKGIYSSSPPYTCALIARNIKIRTGLPWIAGFRDPWTDFISTPNRWIIPKLIDKELEKSVFQEANYVEVAWEGITKDALSKYPFLDKNKFITIPNGFDSNDFERIETKRNEKFTITYTGSMYGRRNPKALLEAFNKLISDGKISIEDFKIRLIGRFGNEIFEIIENSGLKETIEVVNYMAHSDSIKELQKSDVLLLIVDESKESEEIVPGKVYEYMGILKPILVIAPEDGAIAELITETNSGLIAHQSNIEKISENIITYYNRWMNQETIYNPFINKINNYERKNSTKRLAELYDKII